MYFPLDETYIAFGDGSVTPSGTFYGLILLPEGSINHVLSEIDVIKQQFGSLAPLHCRELYNNRARAKSPWAHISEGQAIDMCGNILQSLQKYEPKYLLGHIPSECYPKRFRLKGKNGHPDIVHDIDEKWLMLWCYFRAAALLDPTDFIEPPDPIIIPRPRNLPFWQVVISRSDPGLRVRKVFLDREDTKIRWFSKSFQWITVAKELVIERPDIGKSFLPVESVKNIKHNLLDVADIFVYSTGRSLSQGRSLEYLNFSAEVHLELILDMEEEIILGVNHT